MNKTAGPILLVAVAALGCRAPAAPPTRGGPNLSPAADAGAAVPVVDERLPRDRTPPAVVETIPEAGARGVRRWFEVAATWSEPLDPASVSNATLRVVCDGNKLPATVVYAGGRTVLTPLRDAPAGASCTATLDDAITDRAGNAQGAAYSWSFTIEQDEPAAPSGIDADLVAAIADGQSEVALFLLDRGANPRFRTARADTPLHVAAAKGLTDVARRLLELGADPNAANRLGLLPLKVALLFDSYDVADVLADAGAIMAGDVELEVGDGRGRLSAQAQVHLTPFDAADYPHDRAVLIFQEPHFNVLEQWELRDGLTAFFRDNPGLVDQTVFLSEGVAADQPVSVGPLLGVAPAPSRALVNTVLESFLIPASVAYVWAHAPRLPIAGVEDPTLYQASGRTWADQSYDTWQLTLLARNQRMSEVLIDRASRNQNPVLFVGGKHLDPLPEAVLAAARATLPADLSGDLAGRLLQAPNLGIADHLRAAGIGYTFLSAAVTEPDAIKAGHEARYRRLFQAQLGGGYDDYVATFLVELGPPNGVTTTPAVPAAANLASEAEEPSGSDGDSGGAEGSGKDPSGGAGFDLRGTLREIWNDARLFLNWLKGNMSLSRKSNPINHAQADQILNNARMLYGEQGVDINPDGLAGNEQTGQWAGVPHFKVKNVHIPVQPGWKP